MVAVAEATAVARVRLLHCSACAHIDDMGWYVERSIEVSCKQTEIGYGSRATPTFG